MITERKKAMRRSRFAVARIALGLAAVLSIACAQTRFYKLEGTQLTELPGMPVVYRNEAGAAHLLYVKSTTGFGTSSFTVTRNEDGGYTEFTTNLDSTAAATLAGGVIDKAFEAGQKAAAAEMALELQRLPDSPQKQRALDRLHNLGE